MALLAWFDAGHRDLPWRRSGDPYAIWVSEIMAQQTRVETVIPYYERWLARFPTVADLAAASEDDVFALWQGLGYYSRARNLLRAAQVVMAEHAGALPRTAEALVTLPGVGRYTAGAIASIAFGEAAPLVDGNVTRVFARLFAIEDDVRATPTQKRLWAIAEALVPARRPGDHNQALMELGAVVCTPTSPACDACPVGDLCQGREHADRLPYKKPKKKPRPETRFAFEARSEEGDLLVGRNPSGTLLGGMWQYPMVEAAPESDAAAAFATLSGLDPASFRIDATADAVIHVFSHIRMTVTPVRVTLRAPVTVLDGYAEATLLSDEAFRDAGRATLTRKIARALAEIG